MMPDAYLLWRRRAVFVHVVWRMADISGRAVKKVKAEGTETTFYMTSLPAGAYAIVNGKVSRKITY